MLELALVENIQREDLDAVEIAISYQRLIEECNLTQEILSDRVGKKRSTVSNYIRLLKLPAEIQFGIRNNKISMGHARALVNIEDPETQLMIYEQVIKYDFSVRKVEEVVRQLTHEGQYISRRKYSTPEEYMQLKNHLSERFGCSIEFKKNIEGKGKIVIPFNSDEELERIMGIFDLLIKEK
jgi:ParB family chromosome partitioning protein